MERKNLLKAEESIFKSFGEESCGYDEYLR
jgi:hypothetical protein